jgi:hypothetical protein
LRQVAVLGTDIGQTIARGTDLRLFDRLIWQKQISKAMRGAYPYPGSNLA